VAGKLFTVPSTLATFYEIIMAANLSKLEAVYRFFSGTGFSYDRVATLCTLGFDTYWKKKIIQRIPPHPARIIDQACGTGILTIRIARTFPDCEIIGVELRDEYLDIARDKVRAGGLRNVHFILGRAEDVVLAGGFDCITSSYLAKYAELGTLIGNARKMLRPGGVFIMHDFTYPSNPLFLSLWRAYFVALRVLGSRIYPEWRTVFYELPTFLRSTGWLLDSSAFLEKNAFSHVTRESLTFGTSAIVTATKPEGPPR
jgi:demethylmenaquinone methyltransferase/2-methoxy-6-polyprenyl-1,4-benzoquinol methylase